MTDELTAQRNKAAATSLEQGFTLRLATREDIPALRELIALSVRVLQRGDYSAEQLEAALGTVYGVDTQLIVDESYYVMETASESKGKFIVACGGWSRRRTLFGSDDGPNRDSSLLDPMRDAAKIRAFFVHPDWVRRGLATRILTACEEAAYLQGFRRFEMGATLTGVPMYTACGYTKEEGLETPLGNGMALTVVRMSKRVD